MSERRGLVAYCLIGVLAGIVVAMLWSWTAPRPTWEVGENMRASLGERQLATVIGADAVYAALTALAGIIMGLLAWAWFRHRGITVCFIALLGATAAALIAWQGGELLAPSQFEAQIAAAAPGDQVRGELRLRAPIAVVVAPFFATLVVLTGSVVRPAVVTPEKPRRAQTKL